MKKETLLREIFDFIKWFAVSFVILFILNRTVVLNAQVVSPSMENTIMTYGRVIASRVAYVRRDPQRFDVIIFNDPDGLKSDPFVKRIVGLPGEIVEIRDGLVYIDSSSVPLDYSFVRSLYLGSHGPFLVPENSYFVLGDNRVNSHDSKDWLNPFVCRDEILGRVMITYFPRLGRVR